MKIQFTLKAKLITSFLSMLIIPILATCIVLGIKVDKQSLEFFRQSSDQELKKVDETLMRFFADIQDNVEFLSKSETVRMADESLVNFLDNDEVSKMPEPEIGSVASSIYGLFEQFKNSHNAYQSITLAKGDGSIIKYPLQQFPAKYDPRKEPWFQQAVNKEHEGKKVITRATRSNGVMSVNVAFAFNNEYEEQQALCVSVSLKNLTAMIEKMSFGRLGNLVLVDNFDRIVADSISKERIGTLLTEGEQNPLLAQMQGDAISQEYSEGTGETLVDKVMQVFVGGQGEYAYLYISPFTNWKLIGVVPAKEITSLSSGIIILICTCAAVAAAVGFLFAVTLAGQISNPLKTIIKRLYSGQSDLNGISGLVSESGEYLAEKTNRNAASLREISDNLENVSEMTRNNVDNALHADKVADEAVAVVKEGEKAMGEMLQVIEEVRNSSSQTATIIKTIDDLAFQTNILALNAAVEAARAGEAGKGFAVVADEVRNLAVRCAEAARNSDNLIQHAQTQAENGVESVNYVAGVLGKVVKLVSDIKTLIGEVSEACGSQSTNIEHVVGEITELDTVVQGYAAKAQESASAGNELAQQAVELSSIVSEISALVEGSEMKFNSILQKSDDVQELDDDDFEMLDDDPDCPPLLGSA